MTDATRAEGFYWVIVGQNAPEIAYWKCGEWWFAGNARPSRAEAVTVCSDRVVPHRTWRRPGELDELQRGDDKP